MTADKTSDRGPGEARPSHSDMASTLQSVATAAKNADADNDTDPGDIAADDAGASRLAETINASPQPKAHVEKIP